MTIFVITLQEQSIEDKSVSWGNDISHGRDHDHHVLGAQATRRNLFGTLPLANLAVVADLGSKLGVGGCRGLLHCFCLYRRGLNMPGTGRLRGCWS